MVAVVAELRHVIAVGVGADAGDVVAEPFALGLRLAPGPEERRARLAGQFRQQLRHPRPRQHRQFPFPLPFLRGAQCVPGADEIVGQRHYLFRLLLSEGAPEVLAKP